jgi:hypothetical protein
MARDDPRQQREVVLDHRRRDRLGGHVDHPQARLPQQQEQHQEALLERLGERATVLPEPVDRHRRDHDH